MDKKRREYIISVTSSDRVGIIHDIASAISSMNGDLADMQQQVLRGYFTMILYVSFPEDISQNKICKRIRNAGTADAPFEVSIKELQHPEQPVVNPADENLYVLTADGPDRVGFVATVTRFCKDNSINILDLTTTVSGDRYVMILFVDLGSCQSVSKFTDKLAQFAETTELNMVLQHKDIFRATNEIKIF